MNQQLHVAGGVGFPCPVGRCSVLCAFPHPLGHCREGMGVAVGLYSEQGEPVLIGLGRIPGQSYRNNLRQLLHQSFCSCLPP